MGRVEGRSGRISRAGDRVLRRLSTLSASASLRHVRAYPTKGGVDPGRAGPQTVEVAVVAQAAKTARIVWAVLTSGKTIARSSSDRTTGQKL